MKQTRVFVLLLILVVAGCAKEAKAALVDSNSVVKDGIEYYIQTDKSVYNLDLGEEAQILYRVTNLTENPVDLGTVFDAQSWWYDFLITDDSGTEVWWYPRTFPLRIPTPFNLDPYESKQAEKTWGLINDNGTWLTGDDFPVGTGIYSIHGEIFLYSGERVPVSVNVEVVPEPGTLSLLGAGLIGITLIRKRKGFKDEERESGFNCYNSVKCDSHI